MERDWTGAMVVDTKYAHWAAEQCADDDEKRSAWTFIAAESERTGKFIVHFKDGSLELVSEQELP